MNELGMLVTLIDTTNKEHFVFPIAPSTILFSIGATEINIESIVLGNIPWGRGRNPEKIALEGIFPGKKQNVPRHHFADPVQIDQEIKEHLNNRPFSKEFRLIITHDEYGIDYNIPVYIRDYDSGYTWGDDTIKYSMTLTEYRSYRLRRMAVTNKKAVNKKRTTPPNPKTYTVKQGDNLWSIARRYAGSGSRYMELYNLNKSTLRSKNPNLIYPGEVLQLPKGWSR